MHYNSLKLDNDIINRLSRNFQVYESADSLFSDHFLIDVGVNESESDRSVFSNSSFGKAFSFGYLNFPQIRNIPGTSISIPLYFVGDEAFPLKPRT